MLCAGRAGGSGSLCSTERIFQTVVSDGGRGAQHHSHLTALSQPSHSHLTAILQPSAHGGNYSNWCAPAIPPVEKKSQKFFSQSLHSVRSPAISPSVNCPHVCEASSSSLCLPLQQCPADDYRLSTSSFKFQDRNMLAVR